MSDFNLFEAHEASGEDRRREAAKAGDKLADAISDVRGRFGSFLFQASDRGDFEDRVALCKDDMIRAVDAHLMPVTGTMRRVVRAMRDDWEAQHRISKSWTQNPDDPDYIGNMSEEDLADNESYWSGSGAQETSAEQAAAALKHLRQERSRRGVRYASDDVLVPEGDFHGYLDDVAPRAESQAGENFVVTGPVNEHTGDPADTDFAKQSRRRSAAELDDHGVVDEFRSQFKGIPTPQLVDMYDEDGDDEVFEELHYRMEENDRDAAAAISNDYNAEDPDWTYETGYDGDDVAAGRQAAKGKGKGKGKKPKPQSEYGDAFDNMFGEPMGLLDDMIDSVKLRDRSKESRRKRAAGDPLGQAAEAITQELQEQAEQFQQAIEPLQQALQAVDYAQQVQESQHPMNVQPGEGTVQVIPERNPVPQQIPQGGPEVMPEQAPLEDPNDPYGSQAAQAQQQVQARRRRRDSRRRTAVEVQWEGKSCPDCVMAIANGDDSGAGPDWSWDLLEQHTSGIPGEGPLVVDDEEPSFGRGPCDTCGSPYDGDFHKVVRLGRRRGAGRIDTLRQIVDSHQHQKVDGMLVDVQTANLLLKCYEGVSSDKARSAIETAPLERVVDMAWKVTKQGSRGRRPLGSGRQAAGGGVKVVHNKMLGGWYVVRGPHQTPLSGRFDSKEEAEASLRRESRRRAAADWGSYGEPQRGAECENCGSGAVKGGVCRSCGEGGPRLSDPKKWPANVVNRESSRRQAGGVGIPFGRADGGVAEEGDLDDISDSFREVSEDDVDWSGLWQHVKELKAKGRVDEARSLENRALGYLGARGVRGRRPLGERRASGVSEHTRRRHPWLETPRREAARSVTLIGGGNPHRPEGWEWDRHLSAFTAHQARLFSCSCGDELDMPGYRHCRCGKVWNGYAVASGGDTRTAHADTYLVREVPVRKDVILAGRRGAAVRAANRRLAGIDDGYWSGANEDGDCVACKGTGKGKDGEACWPCHGVGHNDTWADKSYNPREHPNSGNKGWDGVHRPGVSPWSPGGVVDRDKPRRRRRRSRRYENDVARGERQAGRVKDQWMKDREAAGEDPQWTWPSEVGQDSPKVSQSPVDWHRRDSGGKWTPPGVPAKKGKRSMGAKGEPFDSWVDRMFALDADGLIAERERLLGDDSDPDQPNKLNNLDQWIQECGPEEWAKVDPDYDPDYDPDADDVDDGDTSGSHLPAPNLSGRALPWSAPYPGEHYYESGPEGGRYVVEYNAYSDAPRPWHALGEDADGRRLGFGEVGPNGGERSVNNHFPTAEAAMDWAEKTHAGVETPWGTGPYWKGEEQA